MKIVIIDYGSGNLFSLEKAIKRIGYSAIVTNSSKEILSSDKIILPGVGHFNNGMNNLKTLGLIDILNRAVLEYQKPILGICLGMQLLAQISEEGNCKGLGLVEASVKRFQFDEVNSFRIPHMGWNNVLWDNNFILFEGINKQHLFYFVHSYHVEFDYQNDMILGKTEYGYEFVSAFMNENIFCVQFHPEKSHQQGIQLLRNFVEY